MEVLAWAAGNGDRSENADYQYSKRRLRQIDGRVRFLTKRIEAAEVIDPEAPRTGLRAARAFFGATVRYANAAGVERVESIVGTDEVDLDHNHISWASPLGANFIVLRCFPVRYPGAAAQRRSSATSKIAALPNFTLLRVK